MPTRIKICGLTNVDDAMSAVSLGADAVGFILADSKRRIEPETARNIIAELPPFVVTVGVFMNQPPSEVQLIATYAGFDRIQLHGNEPPAVCSDMDRPVIKRFEVGPDDTCRTLLKKIHRYGGEVSHLIDPGAGDGKVFDWSIIRDLKEPYILAGGLNPDNVSEAVRMLHPYGVDVCSGVESRQGKKDADKMKRFIEEVRCL